MSWPLRGVVAAAIGIMLITHQVYLLTMGVANVFAIVLVVLGGFMQLMSWLFGPQLT